MRKFMVDLIDLERRYQDVKWGTVVQNPHQLHEWLHIMLKELMEAKEAADQGDVEKALIELLQAIAVGVACFEQRNVDEDFRLKIYVRGRRDLGGEHKLL